MSSTSSTSSTSSIPPGLQPGARDLTHRSTNARADKGLGFDYALGLAASAAHIKPALPARPAMNTGEARSAEERPRETNDAVRDSAHDDGGERPAEQRTTSAHTTRERSATHESRGARESRNVDDSQRTDGQTSWASDDAARAGAQDQPGRIDHAPPAPPAPAPDEGAAGTMVVRDGAPTKLDDAAVSVLATNAVAFAALAETTPVNTGAASVAPSAQAMTPATAALARAAMAPATPAVPADVATATAGAATPLGSGDAPALQVKVLASRIVARPARGAAAREPALASEVVASRPGAAAKTITAGAAAPARMATAMPVPPSIIARGNAAPATSSAPATLAEAGGDARNATTQDNDATGEGTTVAATAAPARASATPSLLGAARSEGAAVPITEPGAAAAAAPAAGTAAGSNGAGSHEDRSNQPNAESVEPEPSAEAAPAAVATEPTTPGAVLPSAQGVRPGQSGAAAPSATNADAVAQALDVQDPRLEPTRRAADQVTLQFQGEDGLEGRLRISVRGDEVRASILSSHEGTLERLGNEVGSLKRALQESGFTEARIAVHDTRGGGVAATADSRDSARTGGDTRQGEPQRRSPQGRDAREQSGDGAQPRQRRGTRQERRSQ